MSAFKPVISTNADTGKETRYPSMKEAAAAIGVARSQISTACVTGYKSHGCYWRKESDHEQNKPVQ